MHSDLQRFHALDAVRGAALLLGVFLHAAMSFVPQVTWMVNDNDPSVALLVSVFVIHIFRMSLFFVLAGFFAHMLLVRRGFRGFLSSRSKRVALPLVTLLPVVFGLMALVALWAAAYANSGPFAAQATPPGAAQGLPEAASPVGAGAGASSSGGVVSFILFNLPLLHLWFLCVLLWLYAAALAIVGLVRLVDRIGTIAAAIDAAMRVLGSVHLLPFVLAIPLAAVFVWYSPWTQSRGIPAPDGGLIPNIQSVVGYGTAFAFGWFVQRQCALLEIWRRAWIVYLVAAVVLTFWCARIMGAATNDPAFAASAGPKRYAMMAAYPLAMWFWCIALIGMATRFLDTENPRIRYLADSSYWIYLMHLPVIGALQVLVSPWSIAWPLKYALILLTGIPVLLASYQWLVRRTWIGAWLNGRRYWTAAC